MAPEEPEDARVGVESQELADELHGKDFPVVEGGVGTALAQPPIPERLFHQIVYKAVDGYNKGVQVHDSPPSIRVWSPLMVGEPVDPGQRKPAHRVS